MPHRRLGPLVNQLREAREHRGVGAREHPVAEVEDVAGAAACPREHVERLPFDDVPGRSERGRIEVPLQGAVPDERPAVVERQAPVEPDHVPAGPSEVGEQV